MLIISSPWCICPNYGGCGLLVAGAFRCGLRYKEVLKVLWSGSSESQAKSFETKCIFTPGSLPILGSRVGTDEAAKSEFVRQKVETFVKGFQLIRNQYVSAQAALLMLSRCLSFRMNYILRTLPLCDP